MLPRALWCRTDWPSGAGWLLSGPAPVTACSGSACGRSSSKAAVWSSFSSMAPFAARPGRFDFKARLMQMVAEKEHVSSLGVASSRTSCRQPGGRRTCRRIGEQHRFAFISLATHFVLDFLPKGVNRECGAQ